MLVLASASPRRADLLRSAGIAFTVAPVDADERELPGEAPSAYAARVARSKAALALPQHPGAVILAADTTVFLAAGPPLGKPADRQAAATLLRALSSAPRHFVTTAFVLADARGPQVTWLSRQVTTEVRMRSLADDELDAYLDSEEWRDKAGGYGIQGLAGALIPWISGSFTGIMGLPVAETAALLAAVGYPVWRQE